MSLSKVEKLVTGSGILGFSGVIIGIAGFLIDMFWMQALGIVRLGLALTLTGILGLTANYVYLLFKELLRK